MKKTDPGGREAFTLIELLAVILIIAILAALAGFGAKAAMKSAFRASAISNMRALTQAAAAYTADHNGDVMTYRSTEWAGAHLYWITYLPQYYANADTNIMRTKGDDLVQSQNTNLKRIWPDIPSRGIKSYPWSYARNLELPKPKSATSFENVSVKYALLPQPSRTMLLIETRQNAAMYHSYPDECFNFDAEGPNGKTVAAFLDGHVEIVTREFVLGDEGSDPGSWTDSQRLFWFGYPDATGRRDY